MYVEKLIEETEKLLDNISFMKLVKLWNSTFPEEFVNEDVAKKPYATEVLEELRSILIDNIQDIDLEKLIFIHNEISEDEVLEENIQEDLDIDEDLLD